MLEGCKCWQQCCDLGPHTCVCGNDCPKPWSTNPDEWPHTPPLAVYRELEAKDRNLWWRMGQGHGLNLLEDAIEQLDELAASVREREAAAWDAGHSWGWSDAQDAHDVRQSMGRRDWPLCTPNPFKEGTAE